MDNGSTIEMYKEQLIKTTNTCGLTIGTAYYVAKDFLRELEKTYIESIHSEQPDEIKEGTIGNNKPIADEQVEDVKIC